MFLAENLYVASGHMCVTWSFFTRIFSSMQELSGLPDPSCQVSFYKHAYLPFSNLRELLTSRRAFKSRSRDPSLTSLLTRCSKSRCTDFHDKIYGILALVDLGSSFPIDYEIDDYSLFCVVWSFFWLWEEANFTVLLLFSLRVDAKNC